MNSTANVRLLLLLLLSFSFSLILHACGTTIEGGQGIPPVSSGNSITLQWEAPTENTDDSDLIDLAGFRVYYGFNSDDYTEMMIVRGETTCRIDDLPGGVSLYLAVTAFDTSGNESDLSEGLEAILPPL